MDLTLGQLATQLPQEKASCFSYNSTEETVTIDVGLFLDKTSLDLEQECVADFLYKFLELVTIAQEAKNQTTEGDHLDLVSSKYYRLPDQNLNVETVFTLTFSLPLNLSKIQGGVV